MKFVLLKSILVTAVVGSIAYFYSSLPDVSALRTRNPKASALMELRDAEAKKKGTWKARQQIWISYEAVSEHLKKAILVSEDASFFTHKGVDIYELKESIKKTGGPASFNAAAAQSPCSWRRIFT